MIANLGRRVRPLPDGVGDIRELRCTEKSFARGYASPCPVATRTPGATAASPAEPPPVSGRPVA